MARDPVAVESRLRRLDGEALAALVADLWAARGFETRRAGGVVVATRDGRTSRIAVRGLGGPTDGPVDVAVDPRGRRARRGAAGSADRTGARVVDAAALREMLWYAVDRETAATLCERHLGTPPDRLAPPLAVRLRRRLRVPSLPDGRDRRRGPRSPFSGPRSAPLSRSPVALAVALVLLAGVAGAAGVALTDDGRVRGGATPTAEPTAAAVPSDTPRPVFPGLAAVPGVTAAGVTDPAALAAAHDRALGDRYSLWIDVYRPADGAPNSTVRQRDVDVSVAGDRYLLEAALERDRGDRPLLAVYDDGERLYVTDYRNGTVERRALPANATSPATVPSPDVLRRVIVTRYLSTPRTNVSTVVEEDGRQYYRVVGTGAPAGDLAGVTDYTVVALIDGRGLVADLSARYVVETPEGRVPVRFEATYGNTREPFDPPAWYEVVAAAPAADAGDNRTAGAGGH
jgi:hypothetical protein